MEGSRPFCWIVCRVAGRVSPRRATHFLLRRQKKVSKEKATLLSASLRCASGNLRCSLEAGCVQTRFAQTCTPLIRPALRYSPTHNGGEPGTAAVAQPDTIFKPYTQQNCYEKSSYLRKLCLRKWHFSSPILPTHGAERSKGVFAPLPFCMRRGAQLGADQGRACLSRRRVCAHPAQAEQRSVPAGTTHPARLSFAYFSLAKQRKVSRPPGRDPACHASEAGQKEIKQC